MKISPLLPAPCHTEPHLAATGAADNQRGESSPAAPPTSMARAGKSRRHTPWPARTPSRTHLPRRPLRCSLVPPVHPARRAPDVLAGCATQMYLSSLEAGPLPPPAAALGP